MSKVVVTESYLEAIAQAIREKLGSGLTYTVQEMAAAIMSIVTPTDLEELTQRVTALEDRVTDSFTAEQGTASGSVITITDGGNGIPVVDLTVAIDAVQSGSGDPSADNIRPITGWTGMTVTRADAETSPTVSNTYTVSWETDAGTVYGGSLDVTIGLLTVTHANIASYAGETITEPWISSMDVYAEGGTPTTGAQVVYTLETPLTYQLTATEITTLKGNNVISADTGASSLTYAVDNEDDVPTISAVEDYTQDISGAVKYGTITLSTTWTGNGPYSQEVTITGATSNSKIDLQPDATVLAQMLTDGTTNLWAENDAGTITVYAYGAALTAEVTIQYTMMEVTTT